MRILSWGNATDLLKLHIHEWILTCVTLRSVSYGNVLSHRFGPRKAACASTFHGSPSSLNLSSLPQMSLLLPDVFPEYKKTKITYRQTIHCRSIGFRSFMLWLMKFQQLGSLVLFSSTQVKRMLRDRCSIFTGHSDADPESNLNITQKWLKSKSCALIESEICRYCVWWSIFGFF